MILITMALLFSPLLVSGPVVIVEAKNNGVKADGVTDDAPAIQRMLDRIGHEKRVKIVFPEGIIRLASNQDNTPITNPFDSKNQFLRVDQCEVLELVGGGADKTIFSIDTPGVIFNALENKGEFIVDGIGFEYTGGWNTTDLAHAIQVAGPKWTIRNCSFADFSAAIRQKGPNTEYAEVSGCNFTYLHGRASVPQIDPTFNYPIVSILGAGDGAPLVVKCLDNTFNGLTDPTFDGVSPDADGSQKTALDGLIKMIGDHLICDGCSVINHGIEGILFEEDIRERGYVSIISNNTTQFTTEGSTFYAGSGAGIVVIGRNAVIENNIVRGSKNRSPLGISVYLPDDLEGSKTIITNNTCIDLSIGIQISGSFGTTIEGNRIYKDKSFTDKDRETNAAQQIGVRLLKASDTAVTNNVIVGNRSGDWQTHETVITTAIENGSIRAYVENLETVEIGQWGIINPETSSGTMFKVSALGEDWFETEWVNFPYITEGSIVKFCAFPVLPESAAVSAYGSGGSLVKNNIFSNVIQTVRQAEPDESGELIVESNIELI